MEYSKYMGSGNQSVRDYFRHLFHAMMLIFFLSASPSCTPQDSSSVETIEINGNRLTVEIADTDSGRMKGLMHRKTLGDGRGMLFVYDRDTRLSFWMKDTSIPLSIAFISSEGIIREIHDMTPYSLDPVKSSTSVRFALEVNQGYFPEKGISEGDRVKLPERFKR